MGNKFGARAVEIDGIRFASQKEARRLGELQLLERAGAIRDLKLHPRFDMRVNDRHVGFYTADAFYVDMETGEAVVLDIKGGKATRTEAYRLRKRVFEACFPFVVTEE